MNTFETWLHHCVKLSNTSSVLLKPNTRKIFRGQQIKFKSLDDSLQLETVGYTKAKMRQLERNYLVPESIETALALWKVYRHKHRNNYDSIGISTMGHLMKTKTTERRAGVSAMGPCMQSVVITNLGPEDVAIDVYYRTADLLRKFPADLIFLRDVLLKPFDLEELHYTVTCHFANLTLATPYYCVLLPYIDPIEHLEDMSSADPWFYKFTVMWLAQYLCPEHHRGVDGYSQTRMMKAHALSVLTAKQLKSLQQYLRKHHPGYTHEYKTRGKNK